jgi:DMSO/TMAO reductase YedYZ heme-binding membrane subunit
VSPQTLWYISRAAGIVAWLMLTSSVLLGIVLSTDLFPKWRRSAWLLDVHRWLAGLTLFFFAAHIGTLLADPHAHIGLRQATVPFASTWRPTAVAAGVIAAWLLLAVEGTAVANRRLPRWLWRDLHIVSYWVFWATCVHAAFAGTDATRRLYVATTMVGIAAVVFAASYRVLARDLPKRKPERARARREGSRALG